MKQSTAYTNLNELIGLSILGVAGLVYCGQQLHIDLYPSSLEMLHIMESQKAQPLGASIATQAKMEMEVLRFLDDKNRDLTLSEVETILQKSLYGPIKNKSKPLAKHLMRLSAHYRISPALILSVIKEESSFRVTAKSNAGAMGLMQLRPGTAAYMAKKHHIKNYRKANDLYNPFVNLTMGVNYLSYLRHRFANSIHYVAAYNLGPTSVSSMLNGHKFTLGKVEKYVKDIHRNVYKLRQEKVAARTLASVAH